MRIIILLFSLVALSATGEEMQIWRRAEATLEMSGRINNELLDRFRRTNLDNVKQIIITSPGGDIGAATEIGTMIRNQKITVIVQEYCFSACASWIFLPASKKILKHGAVLGLHRGHAEFDMVRMLSELAKNPIDQNKTLIGVDAAKKLYMEAGISQEIYTESAKKTQAGDPKLIYEAQAPNGEKITFELGTDKYKNSDILKKYGDHTVISYRWVRGPGDIYWFPTEKELTEFGVKGLIEYWHPTPKDLTKLEKEYNIRIVGEHLN